MCLASPSLCCKVTPDLLDITEFLITILVYQSVSRTPERIYHAYGHLLGEGCICMLPKSIYIIHGRLFQCQAMHMEVIEDSKGESGLRPVHCGRQELRTSKLNSIQYILTVTIFNGKIMDSISVNNHTVTPGSRETVPTLLADPNIAQHQGQITMCTWSTYHTIPWCDERDDGYGWRWYNIRGWKHSLHW